MENAAALSQTAEDPQRYFWYGVWVLIMVVSALPLVGFRIPAMLPYVTLLVIHEFAAFAYVGHTFFSNVWSMRIRQSQPVETGIWARAFLRKLALSVTGPTAVIVPLAGVQLVDLLGGFKNNPWAWDAYFAFWLMAGFSIVPDVIRYARNRNAGDPQHGMKSGAVRGMLALVMVVYILWCMITKQAFLAPMLPIGSAAADEVAPSAQATVLVAGASGRTGREVLAQASRAGFRAIGMTRDVAAAGAAPPGAQWVAGDVRDPQSLKNALSGATLVICAIGATERSGQNSPEFVDYGGVKNLSDAAKTAGVTHFVLLSSAGVEGGMGLTGWFLNTAFGDVLKWKLKGERYLKASTLPYTIIRPGGLTDGPGGVGGIRITQGDRLGGGSIARADVAAVLVAALGNHDMIGKTMEIAADPKRPKDGWRKDLAALKRD
jgi:uncharacterized protein YbjT (DUF2867 family)